MYLAISGWGRGELKKLGPLPFWDPSKNDSGKLEFFRKMLARGRGKVAGFFSKIKYPKDVSKHYFAILGG